MLKNTRLMVLVALCLLVGVGTMCAKDPAAPQAEEPLHIDIPTTLEKANVVIDFGHLVLNGDIPFALGDVNLLRVILATGTPRVRLS